MYSRSRRTNDSVRLKTIPELIAHDIEFYGNNAYFMWKNATSNLHLLDIIRHDASGTLERKTSAALTFDMERAMKRDFKAGDLVILTSGVKCELLRTYIQKRTISSELKEGDIVLVVRRLDCTIMDYCEHDTTEKDIKILRKHRPGSPEARAIVAMLGRKHLKIKKEWGVLWRGTNFGCTATIAERKRINDLEIIGVFYLCAFKQAKAMLK